MRIKFITGAQCQGQAFHKGQVVDWDAETAKAYVRAGQAVPVRATETAARPPGGERRTTTKGEGKGKGKGKAETKDKPAETNDAK